MRLTKVDLVTDNLKNLLQLIRESHGLSRADLARLGGLSRPAVSVIVEKLLETGLIAETGVGESSGGKPPILLAVVPRACGAIGLDLGEEKTIRGLVSDAAGKIIAESSVPSAGDFTAMTAAATGLIDELRRKSPGVCLRGVGAAISGIVDVDRNEVVNSSNFAIAGCGLAAVLSAASGLPVLLNNRARTAAHAEKTCGNAVDCRNFIYLSIGKSIGCGICSEGNLFRGGFDGAGEIRSIPVPADNGTLTLEEVVRESYLCRAMGELTGRTYEWNELLRAWHEGLAEAVQVVGINARQTAHAAAIAVNLLNPQAVILGGRFKELDLAYLSLFQQHLRELLLPLFRDLVEVRLSRFGRDAAALGAALKIIDSVFRFEI